ncbi:hypothetical protein WAA39_000025 [Enterobacter mori]|uniref:hypothetical protein n=1 Tax=Enterobacter mori TaxID=539813 RepID=UPI0025CA2C0E|nr:hypothetical protein [Enterobacter mori]EKX7626467.1 hypothetical protein [Enterobacter mori]EME8862097.1 hypothetical protein [Enterobacter mori]MEB7568746.1 hypothetical protein [Enterobacter mori]
MDRVELQNELYKLNIPRDSYSIDGVEDEALCLILDGGLWRVFYSEHGKRTEVEYFANESDACQSFLTRITKWF